ncbi:MAG: hypothetical protein IT184_09660 [Acidobacteria bacterium]|nr:hypothetical protein [Acidobacteriota bacterium]
MKSAALQHLESLLQIKRLAATMPSLAALPPAVVSSGVPALDDWLGGGWRQGQISELIGARSSGRTTALVATLRAATRRGAIVALIDAVDRFDAPSAAQAGVDVSRVLWVRGPAIGVDASRPSLVEAAVLEAVRAFDLVIRAGGFAVAALDLADIPLRYVRALPHATWLRLAHANAGRPTAGLIVAEAPVGRSAHGATVRVAATPHWGGESAQSAQFNGMTPRPHVDGHERQPWTRGWPAGSRDE